MLTKNPSRNDIQVALLNSGHLRHSLSECFVDYTNSESILKDVYLHRLNKCIEYCKLPIEEQEALALKIVKYKMLQDKLRIAIDNDEDPSKLYDEMIEEYPW